MATTTRSVQGRILRWLLLAALFVLVVQPLLRRGSPASAQTQPQWRVDAQGNLTRNGVIFRVKGGSWFGLEGRHEPSSDPTNPSGAPMEQYIGNVFWAPSSRTYAGDAAEFRQMGINLVRIPLVPQTLDPNNPQGRDPYLKNTASVRIANSRLALETVIRALNAEGIQVLLDLHSCSNYVGWRKGRFDARPPWSDHDRDNYDYKRESYSCAATNNPPTVTTTHPYDETRWKADLRTLAGMGAQLGVSNIMGIDIFNEPHDYTWAEWRRLIDVAYAEVNAVNPNILIFAQGVGTMANAQDGSPTTTEQVPHGVVETNPNWGENLYEAGANPPTMPKNRLVYSPHTYGPSVFVQKMFMDPTQPNCVGLEGDAAGDHPDNCRVVINPTLLEQGWDEHFGYLKAMGYGIVIGEFGGNFDWPRGTASARDTNRWSHITTDVDAQWQKAFVDYLYKRGIYDTIYWSINPESGDTGGLYLTPYRAGSNETGWGTWGALDSRKMTMLAKLWNAPTGGGPTATTGTNPTATRTATTPSGGCGSTNVALNRPATASSTDDATNRPAPRAVDGNGTTRWASAYSDPQWLQVDLGSPQSICRVVLRWEAAYGRAYQIQTSTDAANWTTIYSTTSGDGGVDDLTVSGSGRYVRVYGTARATSWGYSLWELELFAGSILPTATRTSTTVTVPSATRTSTTVTVPTATRTNTTPPAGCGSTNVALNRPATASSTDDATNRPAPRAVDGNTTTRWASAYSDPQWLQVDLGTTQAICRVRLNWEAAFGRGYQIQTSNDATNWTTIFSTTTGDGGVDDLTVAGSGRYVRMYGTARFNTSWGYSLWELEVFAGSTPPTATRTSTTGTIATATRTATTPAVCGSTNTALYRTASASSQESTSLTPGMANDGSTTTRWASVSGADPQWLQVDLGSVQPVCRVRLTWEAAYGRGYQIQTSTDGTNWTTIYSTTTGDGGVDDLTGLSGSGRYVRMYGTARANTSWGYSLWELEVFGGSGTGPTPTTPTGPSCGQTTADTQANSKARNLLCYLKTHSFISGQTDIPDAEYVQQMTGRYPAIVAFDFYRYTDGDTSETQKAIDWSRTKKGIVAFQWHWKCPRGGEYYGDCDFVPDLTNPSSKLYQDIDLVMRELKKMGDAGVPVLFRPLHESNNNFMWWTKKGSDAYKRLWHLLFERARLAGTHNLVWVFNGMASGQSTPMSQWYPGDGEVDVVSSDYFQSWNDYNTLRAIGSNKVVGIAETFNALNPASEPPFSFSIVWASRDWGGKGSENSWRTAMADSRTISIDQLPDMTRW